MEEDNKDNQTIDDLVEHLKPLVEHMKYIHDMAVVAYTPLVDDICSRNATRNEVELMLDWLLMYAGDDRMLQLYKRVCRAYWQVYPDSIAFYIMEYRKEYDPESLIGTKYEYLLHENEFEEKKATNNLKDKAI